MNDFSNVDATPEAALRELLQFHNLTIEQLSSAAGISPQSIQDPEAERSALKIKAVRRLVEALDLNSAQIAFPDLSSAWLVPLSVWVSGTTTPHGQPAGKRFLVKLGSTQP